MPNTKRFISGLILFAWLVISFAGVTGIIYLLWWKRDLVLYAHKTPWEQRQIVFERAGIDAGILPDAKALIETTPTDMRYELDISEGAGDVSYLTYLLAPRIPRDDGNIMVKVEPGKVSLNERPEQTADTSDRPHTDVSAVVSPFAGIVGLAGSIMLTMCLGMLVCLPYRTSFQISLPEMAAIGSLLVAGLTICSRILISSATVGFALAGILGAVGLILLTRNILLRVRKEGHAGSDEIQRFSSATSLTVLCVLLVLFSCLASFLLSVAVVPDDWDAWAIWGAKAKVLALATGPLKDVTYFGHPDYPLLWPAVWAFSSWCSGGWEEQWSRGWGAVFFLLTAWQIGISASRLTGKREIGFLAAAIFASVPKIIVISSWSYAEAPLWFLTVCSFSRLLAADMSRNWRDAALAGIFAGAATLTKNEGVLFAVLGTIWLMTRGKRGWKLALTFLLPVIILYAPWLWLTRFDWRLGSHATAGLTVNAERMSYVLQRFVPALSEIGKNWLDFRQWGITLIALLLLAVITVVVCRGRSRFTPFIPISMLLTFLTVVVFHNADVSWQVSTSWDRLTAQLIPLLILSATPLVKHPAN